MAFRNAEGPRELCVLMLLSNCWATLCCRAMGFVYSAHLVVKGGLGLLGRFSPFMGFWAFGLDLDGQVLWFGQRSLDLEGGSLSLVFFS